MTTGSQKYSFPWCFRCLYPSQRLARTKEYNRRFGEHSFPAFVQDRELQLSLVLQLERQTGTQNSPLLDDTVRKDVVYSASGKLLVLVTQTCNLIVISLNFKYALLVGYTSHIKASNVPRC